MRQLIDLTGAKMIMAGAPERQIRHFSAMLKAQVCGRKIGGLAAY
jgi:hypothetical protein